MAKEPDVQTHNHINASVSIQGTSNFQITLRRYRGQDPLKCLQNSTLANVWNIGKDIFRCLPYFRCKGLSGLYSFTTRGLSPVQRTQKARHDVWILCFFVYQHHCWHHQPKLSNFSHFTRAASTKRSRKCTEQLTQHICVLTHRP